MDMNEKLSAHFTFAEIIKSETAERKGIDNTPPDNFIPKLQRLCEQILEPIRVHYEEIGGSATSQHCKAEAVDVEVPGVTNYDLAVWIKDNLKFDKLILECYKPGVPGSGWVHVSLKHDGEVNREEVLTYSNRTFTNGLLA